MKYYAVKIDDRILRIITFYDEKIEQAGKENRESFYTVGLPQCILRGCKDIVKFFKNKDLLNSPKTYSDFPFSLSLKLL